MEADSALGLDLARRRDVDASRASAGNAPEAGRRAMAQDRLRPACENRGPENAGERKIRTTHCVDVAVAAMEASCANAVSDVGLAEAESSETRSFDDPVDSDRDDVTIPDRALRV